jgi:hypothetical protein
MACMPVGDAHMPHYLSPFLSIAVVVIGSISFAAFFILRMISEEKNSPYLMSGLLSASILSPMIAVVIGSISSILCLRSFAASPTNLHSLAAIFRDINKPLMWSLVLAILLCGFATIYIKIKIPDRITPSAMKQSNIPAVFSIVVMAISLISFLIYYRAQMLILYVMPPNQYFAGQTPSSVALKIATFLMLSFFTSLLALAILVASLIACLILSVRRKDVLTESNILFMYCADILILAGIIAMYYWHASSSFV